MKKFFTLIILCVFSLCTIHAEITWTLSDDGTLTISGTDMPNYYGGVPWSSQKDKIKKVIIENGVTSIGDYAFFGCSGLTSITIPNSVTSIGEWAFNGCTGLTSVTIPNSVVNIGKYTFNWCTSLTSITIPNSVKSIGESAFESCSGLSSLTIPNSVTSIGSHAFSNCSNLTSITIPNSVKSIGESAFEGCSGLSSLTIPNSVTSIGSHAFSNCSNLTSIAIGEVITNGIQYDVFYNCSKISSITLLEGVTSIGENALFYSSYANLTHITIPQSVTSIKRSAFDRCYNLSYIKVEDRNKYYDSRNNSNAIIEKKTNTLIVGCKNTIIPNSVTSIGDSAFFNHSSPKSIIIPNSVTSIGERAFEGCSGLTSITIPNSVTTIGSRAFSGCSKLTSITIPNSVTSIEERVFSGCSGITSVSIPNSVTSIAKRAFSGCYGLTSVTIPNSVTSIGEGVFMNCYALTSITIPNRVVNIDENTFSGCNVLKNVTIGNSIESIGKNAFYDCYNLQSITVTNPNPPTCISKETFTCSTQNVRDVYDVYNYTTLHIPMGSKEAYSSAQEWRYFNKIKEDMEIDGKVYYAKLSVKQGASGYTELPVKADETYTIYIGALGNSKINAVTFNGKDVTDQIVDGYYTTPTIKAKSVLSISYEDINTTNVKEISNPDLKVTGNEGEISITGVEQPTNVEVYTMDGKLVETRGSAYGDTNIQVKEDNLYLVKVGKRAIKIAM